MLTKTIVKKQLEKLPEEFSLDELVGQLILIQKVEKGLMDSNEGRIISEEELEKEIDKWFE
jgi:predicted transcriptional regulator